MELITGHHGDTVITAKQFAEYNRMLVGDDSAIVYRSRTSNFCATSTSGLYWTMDTGHLLANGRDIAVDEAETVGTDPTTTYNRIDSIFLEVLRDDTTLAERAEFVLELGTEAESPTAPDTPTEADDTLTTLLFAIRVADLVVDGEEITSYTDYTKELPGFATYVTQTEHDADKAKFEETISDLVNVYGAKNLIPYPYYNMPTTDAGVDFTFNEDGSFTANGTATTTIFLRFVAREQGSDYFSFIQGEKYIMSMESIGTITADAQHPLAMWIRVYPASSTTPYVDPARISFVSAGKYNTQFTARYDDSTYTRKLILLEIPRGTVLSNVTFKPMLRMASIDDDTYEPYTMTNQKLTKSVQNIESDISETQDIISDAWSSSKTYAADEYCISGNKLYKCLIANTGTQPPNTTYWEETTCAEEFSELNSNLTELKTDLNNMHIGYTLQTFPSTVGSKYISFSDLVPNYDSSMKYKVFSFKALSRTSNGYSIPTDIGSSSGVAVMTECENERIRLYVDSTGSSYYGTGVSIWYIYMT